MRARARRGDLVARLFERCREVDRVERFPLLVVVRPKRVGDPPAGQREACVMFDRPLEAPDRLLMVERVGPHKSTVEPRLGARRGCRRPTRVGAEIEVGFHRCRFRSELSHVCTDPDARPATRRPPRPCRTPVNCRCSTRAPGPHNDRLGYPPRTSEGPPARSGSPPRVADGRIDQMAQSRILGSIYTPLIPKASGSRPPGPLPAKRSVQRHITSPHNDAIPFAGTAPIGIDVSCVRWRRVRRFRASPAGGACCVVVGVSGHDHREVPDHVQYYHLPRLSGISR